MTKSLSSFRIAKAEGSFILRGGMPGDYHLVAPWCISPVAITLKTDRRKGTPMLRRVRNSVDHSTGEVRDYVQDRYADLGIKAACRRCEGCLKHKRKLWAARAYHETLGSFRTWFGTLTFTPSNHQIALAACMARTWSEGVAYESLPEAEQLAANAETLYQEVDRFWKRLRKAGYRFRYLCVAEPHESGLIHFHVLVHEITPHQVPKSVLEEQWRTGLSHWRLVKTGDKRAVFYVCKYLAKQPENRPRASLHYGSPIKVTRSRSDRSGRSRSDRDGPERNAPAPGEIHPPYDTKSPRGESEAQS